MASCLPLFCQLELRALEAASSDRPCVATAGCSAGHPSGLPKSASPLPFRPSCYTPARVPLTSADPLLQQSLLVTEEGGRLHPVLRAACLSKDRHRERGKECSSTLSSSKLMLSTANPSPISVQGFDAEPGPCCHRWARGVATSPVSSSQAFHSALTGSPGAAGREAGH